MLTNCTVEEANAAIDAARAAAIPGDLPQWTGEDAHAAHCILVTREAYARSARELAAAAPCTACFGTGYVRLNVCKQCGGCG